MEKKKKGNYLNLTGVKISKLMKIEDTLSQIHRRISILRKFSSILPCFKVVMFGRT